MTGKRRLAYRTARGATRTATVTSDPKVGTTWVSLFDATDPVASGARVSTKVRLMPRPVPSSNQARRPRLAMDAAQVADPDRQRALAPSTLAVTGNAYEARSQLRRRKRPGRDPKASSTPDWRMSVAAGSSV